VTTLGSRLFSDVQGSAVLSDDGRYRYVLRRTWDENLPPVLFVGLNPSTADAEKDDPTIRRCVRFARDWGYGGLLMGNLFAFRATRPQDLPNLYTDPPTNPVGEFVPERSWQPYGRTESVNDEWLRQMATEAGIIVAAWGATPLPLGWGNRATAVHRDLDHVHALGLTKDGHPRHPLYVRADAHPIPLPPHVHDWNEGVMYEGSQEKFTCQTCGAVQWD
jgi:hypothetical protein